jgi:hypothetical protein
LNVLFPLIILPVPPSSRGGAQKLSRRPSLKEERAMGFFFFVEWKSTDDERQREKINGEEVFGEAPK